MVVNCKLEVAMAILCFLCAFFQTLQWDSLSGVDAIYKMPAHIVQEIMFFGAFLYIISVILLFFNTILFFIVSISAFTINFPMCFRQILDFPFRCFFINYGNHPMMSCVIINIIEYGSVIILLCTFFLSINMIIKHFNLKKNAVTNEIGEMIANKKVRSQKIHWKL